MSNKQNIKNSNQQFGEKSHVGNKSVSMEDSMDVEKYDNEKSQVVHDANVGKEINIPKGSSDKSHIHNEEGLEDSMNGEKCHNKKSQVVHDANMGKEINIPEGASEKSHIHNKELMEHSMDVEKCHNDKSQVVHDANVGKKLIFQRVQVRSLTFTTKNLWRIQWTWRSVITRSIRLCMMQM